MSLPPDSPNPSRSASLARWWLLAVGVPLTALLVWYVFQRGAGGPEQPVAAREPAAKDTPEEQRKDKRDDSRDAPELDGGVAWLNTAGPLRLKDLRGKIVLLDFWTLCCINCMHVLPDLAKLEKKYPNELVVIGVHTAKFDNEKNTESIRKAILRYEVSHPVVNDADMRIWRTYGSNSWPTLCLIDPEGTSSAPPPARAITSCSTASSPGSSRSTRTRRRSTRSR